MGTNHVLFVTRELNGKSARSFGLGIVPKFAQSLGQQTVRGRIPWGCPDQGLRL